LPYCETADGVRLYYQDFGEGPAVVFTPSGSQTHQMWESQVAALSGEYRTVAYDWRGTGRSDKPRAGYTTDAAAADLAALIERLGLAPATLVGHGIGNHLGILVATRRPDLVAGLVLASAAPWFTGTRDGVAGGLSPEFIDLLARGAQLGDARGMTYPDVWAELSERLLFHHPQSAALHQSVLEQALAWPQHVVNTYAKSLRELDHRERLALIQCPALIVQGRHDRKSLLNGAEYMARKIRNARLVVLEDSGHMVQAEEINAFNRALLSFIATTRAAQRAA
jgi:pimeloyl-ACP methyl ester carboxylesterase